MAATIIAGGFKLLALSLAAPSIAQSSKPAFKPLDVFDLQWAADPQVSPDGRGIAYVRMGFDIKTDRARGAVWLAGRRRGRARNAVNPSMEASRRFSRGLFSLTARRSPALPLHQYSHRNNQPRLVRQSDVSFSDS